MALKWVVMCVWCPCLPPLAAPDGVSLFGDWQRRTHAAAPWGAPVASSPALISPAVTLLVQGEVVVLEAAPPVASAAVGSVSGPYWLIQAIPSPSSSLNSRWRRSQIIWRLKDLSHRRSGESEWRDRKSVHVFLFALILILMTCCHWF